MFSRNTFPVDTEIYKPSPWGVSYHNLTVDEALGAGAAGPGKSLVLLMEPFVQIALENERCSNPDHPHHMKWGQSVGWALHIRRTQPRLLQTLARAEKIFRAIEPDVRFVSKSSIYIFKSGFRYQFGHVRNPGDWSLYDSQEYTIVLFDELVEILEEQYEMITLRLRTSDPVLRTMLKVRSMSNPLIDENLETNIRTDPLWVRKRFVDPWPSGRKILTTLRKKPDGDLQKYTRIYLPATLYDNPDKEFVKDYESRLLSKPQYIVRSRLYGDWYVTAGSFYMDMWNPGVHTIKPIGIPRNWRVFRSMDWGYMKPGCVLWYAITPEDRMYQIYELTFIRKYDVEVADKVLDIDRKLGFVKGRRSYLNGPADTQLWESRGDSAISKAAAMAKRGVYWVAAKKNKRRNVEIFSKRLTTYSEEDKLPQYLVFNTCKKTIMTIGAIKRSKDDPEMPADGGDDHWHDGVLYACAYAEIEGVGLSLNDFKDMNKEDEDDDEERRGTTGYGYGFGG